MGDLLTRNGQSDNENLYHVLFNISHSPKDVSNEVEKLRICGTYTDLKAAKAAAHQTIFDAGYEKEIFTEYYTNPDEFKAHHLRRRTVGVGLNVYALAEDGTVFRVSIATTPNVKGFRADPETHKLNLELYHVVQTIVLYDEDESGDARQTIVEGSFQKYVEARQFASRVLLSADENVTKESFARYDEAVGLGERDCGYGENVVVHAVGNNGENINIIVLKEQEMEAMRLAEAAVRI